MQLIRFLLRYSRWAVLVAAVAGLVSGACNTALLAHINNSLKGGSLTAGTVASFVGLVLLLPVSRFMSELLLARLGQGALFDQRMRLSRHILAVPLQYLEQLGAHRVLTMLMEDVPVVSGAVVMIPLMSVNVAVFLGGLIYLGWLSPMLLLVVLGALALGVIGYQFTMFKANGPMWRMRYLAGELVRHFNAMMEGTKELKLHQRRRADFLSLTLRPTAEDYRRATMKNLSLQAAAASWGQSFIFVVIGLVILFALKFETTSPHVLTGYVLVLIYIMSPLQMIMNAVPTLTRANVAVVNIERLGFDLSRNAEGEPEAAWQSAPAWERLTLEDVTYTYYREGDDEPFTLGPLNLTFGRGEVIFIVGGNGSGKTTLAKLLTGLYVPADGRIYLDGRLIDEESVESYRQQFSAVFSDFYLFDGFPGLDARDFESSIQEHLQRLHLAHKVQVKDGRLSTVKLSQGQRKRLALLTAYLEDRPIYLFDEWAADQDPYFREVFYRELLPGMKEKGKTLFVVTHDDRYFHLADRVIKLEYGQVVSQEALPEESRELVAPAE